MRLNHTFSFLRMLSSCHFVSSLFDTIVGLRGGSFLCNKQFVSPTFVPQIWEYGNFSVRKLIFTSWFPGLQSEYKFPDRNITIFSNLWYKSGSIIKNGVKGSRFLNKNELPLRYMKVYVSVPAFYIPK